MMLKKALVGLSLLALSSAASAALVVSESIVNGAEMVGLEVTVSFADGSSESGVWAMISNTPLATGDPILNQNGYSGGVVANSWSLTQAGDSLGGFDDFSTPYGMWTLSNTSSASAIQGFTIMGMNAGIAFDIIDTMEATPGSDSGQSFVSDLASLATYSDQVDVAFSDLFWSLTVSLDADLAAANDLRFFADTDMLTEVSAPASLAFVLAGLGLFSRRLSRKSV